VNQNACVCISVCRSTVGCEVMNDVIFGLLYKTSPCDLMDSACLGLCVKMLLDARCDFAVFMP